MTILLVFLAFFVLLGLASVLGFGADSRDPTYTLAGDVGARRHQPRARVVSGR
jgi:hypothetical protein